MWPFRRKRNAGGIRARSVTRVDGVVEIDVRGQTCPGYLLAIDREVEKLEAGEEARLVISYPPCGDDVQAWCRRKGVEYLGMEVREGLWLIGIRKQRASPQSSGSRR